MSVNEILYKLESLVADASYIPLTNKAIVSEDMLIQLIEELRKELPTELSNAEEIMQTKENIIKNAKQEADTLIKRAKFQAERLIDEDQLILRAREQSQMILSQAKQQEKEIIKRAQEDAKQLRDDVELYANQVFDRLIACAVNTSESIQKTQESLDEIRVILQDSRLQLNRQLKSNDDNEEKMIE